MLPRVGSGAADGTWRPWSPCTSVPHLPRGLWIPPDPQASAHAALTNLQGSWAADRIYDSVDALARALRAELAGFAPWQRVDPSYQPTLSGWVWTSDGPRRVSVMLDTGATHCFIGARLAELLRLPLAPTPGPTRVALASSDPARPLAAPVLVHLELGTTVPLREVVAMSPLDLGPGLDIILGWDWISAHDLRFLHPRGEVVGTGPGGPLAGPLAPRRAGPPLTAAAHVLISHGEMRRMLRALPPSGPTDAAALRVACPAAPEPPARHGGMSKPLEPLGATIFAEEAHQQRLRRLARRRGIAPPPVAPRFADGIEIGRAHV